MINLDTVIVLEGMMRNLGLWNNNFRNEAVKRDCLDVIKYQHEHGDKVLVIARENVALFLKKNVKSNLIQMIERTTAYDTYKDLVDMAPEKALS